MRILLSGGKSRAEVEAAKRRHYDSHPKLPNLSWRMSAGFFGLLCLFAVVNGCRQHLPFF